MSRVERLARSFAQHIAIPWRDGTAAPQRVIFCVYNETDELRLRARIDEFEISTRTAGHSWNSFDLTDTFAKWLAGQRYAESYFQQPNRLTTLVPTYLPFIVDEFTSFLASRSIDEKTVVALSGVGSLFGFLKVKDVVDALAPLVKGRLVVFFPGTYENNNYRLLNGYDGWNYLAVTITADKEF